MSKRKKEKNVIRFVLGTSEERRSEKWRLWVEKNEVYLSAFYSGRFIKVSLHSPMRPGFQEDWRVAFVKECKRQDNLSDRVILRWTRPKEFAPGFTLGVGVLVSPILPKHPFPKKPIEDSRVITYSPVNDDIDHRVVFRIFISSQDKNSEDVRKVMNCDGDILGQIQKENGERIWLVATEFSLAKSEEKRIQKIMKRLRIYVKPGTKKDFNTDARALMLVSEKIQTPQMQPVFFDVALGFENIYEDRVMTRLLDKISYLIRGLFAGTWNPLEL